MSVVINVGDIPEGVVFRADPTKWICHCGNLVWRGDRVVACDPNVQPTCLSVIHKNPRQDLRRNVHASVICPMDPFLMVELIDGDDTPR